MAMRRVSLWDDAAIDKHIHVDRKPSTRIKFTAEDSFSGKTNMLDMSVSMKASYLGGLIEVEGSASYLKNRVSSTKQCRMTMKYEAETEYKHVHINELGPVTYPQVFEQQGATHMVIGVTYGAKAFMVFDRMTSDEEEKQEIQAQLNVMIKKIPKMEISGEGKVSLADEEKKKVEGFSCTFYGDFMLKYNPSTYEEAVQVYKELPKLVGEKGGNAVPVKVHLYPLTNLNPKAAKLVREIRVTLVSDAENVLQELLEAKIRANDLIVQLTTIKVDYIEEKLTKFQDELDDYTTTLRQNLGKILSAIRAGTEEEQTLLKILKFHEESFFSQREMKKWLDEKDTEIQVLTTHINPLCKRPEVSIQPPGPKLDTFILNSRIDWLYVLNFTSLKYEEPYLSTLSECLSMAEFRNMENISVAHHHSIKEEGLPWYKDPRFTERIRSVLDEFESYIGSYKHIISYKPDPEYQGACFYLYNYGKLYSCK
ncbi:stonustoxin subunit alpha-like [Megalops cyprinoides]|uniref:stonustoxin subunit alpha-like n=1 Tax=Megalops cyprinoides TaxID=118141 RepID=UPI001865365C|nr:stonustoxin subunit alpha-like [Megalops cyprinoides]